MANAIIGHTGFIGSNLCAQAQFEARYNSKNIEEIAGQTFDLVVCAGAPAEKWRANREPETDKRVLRRLMDNLGRASARQVVLISTADVYPDPVDVDERSEVDWSRATAYGQHRRNLELFVEARFPTLTVRLPGLFGPGLKKNIIYDLLHDNAVDQINPDSVYQFYNLDYLWRDLGTCLRADLRQVNFATEPASVADIAREIFGLSLLKRPASPPARYDLRSAHADLFGGADGYLYRRLQILDDLRAFVARQRAM